ncbi:MAG: hypothetical protein P1Q69_17105 [Candidatus Thorarchaeota archaeon]|nr:hypothetical protein [Candidatus Thorarchaeota archaeon]
MGEKLLQNPSLLEAHDDRPNIQTNDANQRMDRLIILDVGITMVLM